MYLLIHVLFVFKGGGAYGGRLGLERLKNNIKERG